MPDKAFAPGAGRISGYLSGFLGIMSLLAVLCFRFPAVLTTEEIRENLDIGLLRLILRVAIWVALGTGLFSLTRNRKKVAGLAGVTGALAAMALGGWRVEAGVLTDPGLSVGLDWLLVDFLVSAGLFIFIEKLWPRYPDQIILRPGWRLDLTYFGINHLLIGVLLLVANRFSPTVFGWAVHPGVQEAVRSLPVVLQTLLLLLAVDLVQYWIHRAYHEVPWLWKIHAIHHSAEHLDWLAGSRNHTLQIFIDRSLATVPIYLLGADPAALDAFVLIAGTWAVFIHCNVGIPFGFLRTIIATPQFHHWHHSSDKPAIDTNYAVTFSFLDRLFGTYHLPEHHWPLHYGTTKPVPPGLWRQFLYPFVPEPAGASEASPGSKS